MLHPQSKLYGLKKWSREVSLLSLYRKKSILQLLWEYNDDDDICH
jgi:hypothetical protein